MKELLEKIGKLRILVIGDLMLDHYVWGDASRLSQEAPVPIVAVKEDTHAAGAAANVALNLKALGCRVELCGIVGEDDAGRKLLELLKEEHIGLEPDFIAGGVSTIMKTRVVVRKQQLCRIDREAGPKKYRLDEGRHFPAIEDKVNAADAVILSDYAKGVIDEPLIQFVQERARKKGSLVSYDPKPKRQLDCKGLDLMTPNQLEAMDMAGIKPGRYEFFPAEAICSRIWKRYQPAKLVVTLGGGGMLLSEGGKFSKHIPTYAREVFDVSGAGDTVIASLTAALAAGVSMEDAAQFANTAAGVVVGKFGTAAALPEEIIEYARRL